MRSMIYLGTTDGVVALSSADGQSWEIANRGLKNLMVTEVAVVPSASHRVFAGTRGDGVWFSEDSGKSWRKPNRGRPGPGKVRCLTPSSEERVLYAGCEPIDIYVSEDSGKSWQRIESVWETPEVAETDYPVASIEPHVRDIAIDPKDPKIIFAALQVGFILKSRDGGSTWELLTNSLDSDVHTIVVDPRDPRNLFIATGGEDSRLGRAPGRALYVSRDGGQSWSIAAMNFSQEYSIPLVMHPTDSSIVYSALAGGPPSEWDRPSGPECVVVRTADGGKSWERVGGGLEEISGDFVQAMAFDGNHPDRIYAGLRSGEIFASFDGGEGWKNVGVKVSQIIDMKWVTA